MLCRMLGISSYPFAALLRTSAALLDKAVRMIQDPAASVIVALDTEEQRVEFQELLQSCKKRVESGSPKGLLENFSWRKSRPSSGSSRLHSALKSGNFDFVKMCQIRWTVSFMAISICPSATGIFRLIKAWGV